MTKFLCIMPGGSVWFMVAAPDKGKAETTASLMFGRKPAFLMDAGEMSRIANILADDEIDSHLKWKEEYGDAI